jgi:phosphate-selective porin OprO/OprP
LTDSEIRGGEQQNITAGLNWYLNGSTRFMFNYVKADLKNRENVPNDKIDIFQARFQIDF